MTTGSTEAHGIYDVEDQPCGRLYPLRSNTIQRIILSTAILFALFPAKIINIHTHAWSGARTCFVPPRRNNDPGNQSFSCRGDIHRHHLDSAYLTFFHIDFFPREKRDVMVGQVPNNLHWAVAPYFMTISCEYSCVTTSSSIVMCLMRLRPASRLSLPTDCFYLYDNISRMTEILTRDIHTCISSVPSPSSTPCTSQHYIVDLISCFIGRL